MGYAESLLSDGERVAFRSRQHWLTACLAGMARARTLDMSRKEERALQIMARHFGAEAADDPAA